MKQEDKIQPHQTYVSTIENATAMPTVENTESIGAMIMEFRGQQVMLDRDLARLYGVTTSRLNEQVKRNIARFPESFRFQLTEFERDKVVAKCDNLQAIKYSPSLWMTRHCPCWTSVQTGLSPSSTRRKSHQSSVLIC